MLRHGLGKNKMTKTNLLSLNLHWSWRASTLKILNKTGNDIWYPFRRIILIGDSESRAQCDCDDILTFVVRPTGRKLLAFLWCVKIEILDPQLSGAPVLTTAMLAGKQIHHRMQNFVRNTLVLIILLYPHLFWSYSRKTSEPLWAARGSYRVNITHWMTYFSLGQ